MRYTKETDEQIIRRWTRTYIQLSDEKDTLWPILTPILEQIDEIEELEQVGEYRKPRVTPLSHLKPGLMQRRNELQLRIRHIDEFRAIFRRPEMFQELSEAVMHRLLRRVNLNDSDLPLDMPGIRSFLNSVIAPVPVVPDDEPWFPEEAPVAPPVEQESLPSPTAQTLRQPSPVHSGWGYSPPWPEWEASPIAESVSHSSPVHPDWGYSPPWSECQGSPVADSVSHTSPVHSGLGDTATQSVVAASSGHSHVQDDLDWEVSWPSQEPTTECASCCEAFSEQHVMTSKCSHSYCQNCATHMLEHGLREEVLFPPRCCGQELPLKQNMTMFSDEIWVGYLDKAIEHNDKDRTYCHDPKCSKYIPPINVQAQNCLCSACNKQTCKICKKAAHSGWCCDKGDDTLFELAKKLGWQRCSSCRYFVERKWGCDHITCLCGYQYCYKCGAEWKTCNCVHVPEPAEDPVLQEMGEQLGGNLGFALAMAERRLALQTWDVPEEQLPLRQLNATAVLRRLCHHDRVWTQPAGHVACPGCPRVVVIDLYECNLCGLRACGPCRRYRHTEAQDNWPELP